MRARIAAQELGALALQEGHDVRPSRPIARPALAPGNPNVAKRHGLARHTRELEIGARQVIARPESVRALPVAKVASAHPSARNVAAIYSGNPVDVALMVVPVPMVVRDVVPVVVIPRRRVGLVGIGTDKQNHQND